MEQQQTEIWDSEQLLLSLGVMKQIMPKLVETFLNQSKQLLESISEQTNSQLLLTAHSLKGSGSQLCCRRLAAIASQLEQQLKNQETDDVLQLRLQLMAELRASSESMQSYLSLQLQKN
jgi:HPt (histidine-containing phosphotransfer) domain-containing protein